MTKKEYAEALELYKWEHLCFVTFRPRVPINDAFETLRTWVGDIGRREHRRLHWIAVMNKVAWAGPFIYLVVGGIEVPFSHYVYQWNQSVEYHCHIIDSNCEDGLQFRQDQRRLTNSLTQFRAAIQTPGFKVKGHNVSPRGPIF
jgi:hypothetical protein